MSDEQWVPAVTLTKRGPIEGGEFMAVKMPVKPQSHDLSRLLGTY